MADSAADISETRTADISKQRTADVSLQRTADVRKTIYENFFENLVYIKKLNLNLM